MIPRADLERWQALSSREGLLAEVATLYALIAAMAQREDRDAVAVLRALRNVARGLEERRADEDSQ